MNWYTDQYKLFEWRWNSTYALNHLLYLYSIIVFNAIGLIYFNAVIIFLIPFNNCENGFVLEKKRIAISTLACCAFPSDIKLQICWYFIKDWIDLCAKQIIFNSKGIHQYIFTYRITAICVLTSSNISSPTINFF